MLHNNESTDLKNHGCQKDILDSLCPENICQEKSSLCEG